MSVAEAPVKQYSGLEEFAYSISAAIFDILTS